MLKTVFFGTPQVAVPFLEQLSELTQTALVITQPDRPAGRGLALKPCAVKQSAQKLALPVLSPEVFKDSVPQIAALKADLGLAVAYGKIFKKPALQAFKHGILNIHFSLLPEYRGAAPVQQALFDGQSQTGITIFWIDEGLDTGLIAAQKAVPILPQDDAATLFPKLIETAKLLLPPLLADIESGKITKTAQQGAPSHAPQISKESTLLSFGAMTAAQIHNKVRGLALGIPAYAKAQTLEGDLVQILKTRVLEPQNAPRQKAPGQISAIESGLGFFVQCSEGSLLIEALRPAGKKTMAAADYANGKKLAAGMLVFM